MGGSSGAPSIVRNVQIQDGPLTVHGEQTPRTRHALQLVLPTFHELDAQSNNEVPDDRRDQGLAGTRQGRRPGTNVDGHPGDVVSPVSYTHLRAHETDSYLVCR